MLCRFLSCLLRSYVVVILSPAFEMKSQGLGEVRSSREGIYSSKAHVHNRCCSKVLGTVSITHQKGCFSPELTRKDVHAQPISTVQLSCITFSRIYFLLWTTLLENVVHGSTGTMSDLSSPRKLPGTPQWLHKYLWKGRITDQVNKGLGKIAQPRSSPDRDPYSSLSADYDEDRTFPFIKGFKKVIQRVCVRESVVAGTFTQQKGNRPYIVLQRPCLTRRGVTT